MEFSLLAGFAAPSLVGNTIVLKSASATTQRGIEIEKCFKDWNTRLSFSNLNRRLKYCRNTYDSADLNAVTFTVVQLQLR